GPRRIFGGAHGKCRRRKKATEDRNSEAGKIFHKLRSQLIMAAASRPAISRACLSGKIREALASFAAPLQYSITGQQTGAAMAEALVRGIAINYEVIGSRGPWIAFTPGSRRPFGELADLSQKIAASGFRVLLHDRRNCGASDVAFDG